MGLKQRITLDEIAPADPTWHDATPAIRLAFAREAGDRMVAIKRAELARGLGANGRRMQPRKRPREDGADGPVLTPHRAESRTSRLMAAHAAVGFITLFWRSGHSKAQRLPWGTILGFHAGGHVQGAPARDVRMSRKGLNRLKGEMATWWAANHAPALRDARGARLAAAAAERKDAAKKPGVGKRAVDAMAKRYKGLAAYLSPKRGGGL